MVVLTGFTPEAGAPEIEKLEMALRETILNLETLLEQTRRILKQAQHQLKQAEDRRLG
jgi:hypothetical protein